MSSRSLLEKIERLKIKLSIPNWASQSDKYLFDSLNAGLKEKNYEKIYKVIESIECGVGFKIDSGFYNIVNQSIVEDEEGTVEVLQKKNNLIDIVYILKNLDYNTKIKILENHDIRNSLLLFELIRTCLNNKSNNDTESKYVLVLSQSVINLSNMDDDMFRYLIKRFENKRSFALVIGNALNRLDESSMNSYIRTITIDKYPYNIDNVSIVLNCIEEYTFKNIYIWCGEYLLETWKKFLLELERNESIVNDIVISSYSKLIVKCMCYKYECKEDYYEELKSVIDDYESKIYSWYDDVCKETTVYFIEITIIYMIKLVKDYNEFTWDKYESLHERVKKLLQNKIFHKRHWKFAENRYEDLELYSM